MAEKPTRRSIIGALSLGAVSAPLDIRIGHAQATNTAPSAQLPGTCVLFPQAVEGPYYFDPKLVRADISEGRPGLPLKLVLKLIDNGSCAPIEGARIDIWHCDAGGIYSGYARQGDKRNISAEAQHYLRGTQLSDAKGYVTFQSIYPGWYPGRTPHIHIKALLNDKSVLTGQVYFPDEMSLRVYNSHAPYNQRPVPDTSNTRDFIFREGAKEGGGIILAMEEAENGVTGTLLIAVDQSGAAAKRAQGIWQRLFGGR